MKFFTELNSTNSERGRYFFGEALMKILLMGCSHKNSLPPPRLSYMKNDRCLIDFVWGT